MEEAKTDREESSSSPPPFLEENKPSSSPPSQRSMGHASFPNTEDDKNNPSTALLRSDSSSSKSSKRSSLTPLPACRQDGQGEEQGEKDTFRSRSSLPRAASCDEDSSSIDKQKQSKSSSLSSRSPISPKASPGRLSLGVPQSQKEVNEAAEGDRDSDSSPLKPIHRGRGPPRASAAARKLMENDETLKKILTDTEQLENLRHRNVRKNHEGLRRQGKGYWLRGWAVAVLCILRQGYDGTLRRLHALGSFLHIHRKEAPSLRCIGTFSRVYRPLISAVEAPSLRCTGTLSQL